MSVADESACLTTRVGTIEREVPRGRDVEAGEERPLQSYRAMKESTVGTGLTDASLLGFTQTTTERSEPIVELLRDLLEPGLTFEEGILCIIDGSKGLRKAVGEVFDSRAEVQCRIGKGKRWHHSPQRHQWMVLALLEAESRMRRISGYEDLPELKSALKETTSGED
jgi:transposase-like protein